VITNTAYYKTTESNLIHEFSEFGAIRSKVAEMATLLILGRSRREHQDIEDRISAREAEELSVKTRN
jgi:hypothetical protein